MTTPEFIQQIGSVHFHHQDELLCGLDEASWSLSSYTGGEKNRVTGEQLMKAYGTKGNGPDAPEDFKDLVDALLGELKTIVDVWSFCNESHFINVFIARTGQVLGAVKTPA